MPLLLIHHNFKVVPMQLTVNILRSLANVLEGSHQVKMNKCSCSNVNGTFVRSYMVFRNSLKTLAQKHYCILFTEFLKLCECVLNNVNFDIV